MLIKNRYRKIERIAKSNFCETFLAEDVDCLSRKCVIKELTFLQENPDFYLIREKFQQEAKVLHDLGEAIDQNAALRHQIPKLYAYFSENNQFYLVQEWVQGETLEKHLKAQGRLQEGEVIQFLMDILPVIRLMHARGIVHRDIKPGNLMIRKADRKPVLIDFGIVKELAKIAANQSTLFYTPGFGAPEQELGQQIYPSTDLYALGITAIYALTGESPKHWMSYPPRRSQWHQFAVNVSDELRAILDKAIQPRARDRYSTAQEMLDAVQSLDPGGSTIVESKKRFLYPFGFVAAGVLVAIGLGYFYFNHHANQIAWSEYEAARERGDYPTCIAKAKQLNQFHLLSQVNATDSGTELETQCAESAAAALQKYLREDVPKRLQEQDQASATIITTIKPSVQVPGEEVIVIYDASSDPAWSTEPFIKYFARLFMTTLNGGTSDGVFPANYIPKKYQSFTRLVVYPQGSNTKAIITKEQWKAYINDLDNASSQAEKDAIAEKFLEQIRISTQ